MNGKLIKFPLMYWNTHNDTAVCFTGIVLALENELELFVTNYPKKQLPAHFLWACNYSHEHFVFCVQEGLRLKDRSFHFSFECIFCIDYCPKFSLIIIN